MAETIPFNPDDLRKEPLDDYGKDKFASEMYLKEEYRKNGFPSTIIMPGQISRPGWTIINPCGNTSMRVFQDIAEGKEIALPNFGQEILHRKFVVDIFWREVTHQLFRRIVGNPACLICLFGSSKFLIQFHYFFLIEGN